VLALESFDASTMENLSKKIFESEATVTAANTPNPNAAAAR